MTLRNPTLCATNRRRDEGNSLTKGFVSLTLVLSLSFVLASVAGGYWLGYSHRDAQCKATASTRQVEALVGTINRASNTEAIKQQLDEQSIQQQAAAEQVQSMIRKEQKQREQFWSKQREANQSCDAWLRAVVPCRMQPEANGNNAATTDSVAATTRMPQ
jgi:uncharacterized protein HemX